jgi:hypothetical protein
VSATAIAVIGWDVGGVNTKVARVAAGRVLEARARPFEIQRDPAGLRVLLRALGEEVGAVSADAAGAGPATTTGRSRGAVRCAGQANHRTSSAWTATTPNARRPARTGAEGR